MRAVMPSTRCEEGVMEKLAAFVEAEEQPREGLADMEGSTDARVEAREGQLLLELAILTLEVALRIEALEVAWRRRGAVRRARSAQGGA